MHDVADRLAAAGVMPPLVDPSTGEPYESLDLPCCTADPLDWDAEAPRPRRRLARLACRSCPARRPCSERARNLGPLATGVWAGRDRGDTVDDDTPRGAPPPLVYDAAVASWLVRAAVELRAPRPARRQKVSNP